MDTSERRTRSSIWTGCGETDARGEPPPATTGHTRAGSRRSRSWIGASSTTAPASASGWRPACASLRPRGARGLKVWKNLGLHLRDARGKLLMPDDRRLTAVWEACAAGRRIPITDSHRRSRRVLPTPQRPATSGLRSCWRTPIGGSAIAVDSPRFQRLMDRFERLVGSPSRLPLHRRARRRERRRPRVGLAHARHVPQSQRRHRRSSRRTRAAATCGRRALPPPPRPDPLRDRRVPPAVRTYQVYARFLETPDEHFAYSAGEAPGQGRWAVSGLDLPDSVLRKVYRDNARRLIRVSARERSRRRSHSDPAVAAAGPVPHAGDPTSDRGAGALHRGRLRHRGVLPVPRDLPQRTRPRRDADRVRHRLDGGRATHLPAALGTLRRH